MARILLGVSGGIAAYKSIELARLATQAGHGVRVVLTPSAHRFVGAATFEGITGAPVLTEEFEPDPARGAYPGEPVPEHAPISHLALAEGADVLVVAPASANTLAKLAAGICDSLLTTSYLATAAPRIVAPAMNNRMWEDEAVRANVATLRARGADVLEPGTGELASRGERGPGRMREPAEILDAIEAALGARAGGPWEGLRVLVTAGGTREAIDPVRFIGNRSSGRMGVALAAAAARRGAHVQLVAANLGVPPPAGVDVVAVESAAELATATAERFAEADVLLMAAAVADFRPASSAEGKIVRDGSGGLDLHLEPTEDVLAGLAGQRHAGQLVVGFAAEHGGDFVERARGKLERKGLDAIVVNDVSDRTIGFDSAENEVTIVEPASTHAVAKASKGEIAEAILDRVDVLRGHVASGK